MNLKEDFFVYGSNFLNLAAGASVTNVIQIQAGSAFILQKLTRMVALQASGGLTDATKPYVEATVLITDSTSGRNLMSQAIALECLFGTAENPFIMPKPKRFEANTTISVTVTSAEPTNALDIYLAFIGVKEFMQ